MNVKMGDIRELHIVLCMDFSQGNTTQNLNYELMNPLIE